MPGLRSIIVGLLVLACASCAQMNSSASKDANRTASIVAPNLSGTSWQLVEFEGGDGVVLAPDEKSKYTLAFTAENRVAVRFDCNRGSGGWKSAGPGQIEFGPMAMTRAMCPPGSLHDHFVKQWPYVRSYLVREGHLYLSLMADGGTFEFEPVR